MDISFWNCTFQRFFFNLLLTSCCAAFLQPFLLCSHPLRDWRVIPPPLPPKKNIYIYMHIRINKFLQTDFTKKVNIRNERRFKRPTVIFRFMIKSKISMCLYTIVKGLMRYLLRNNTRKFKQITT